MTTTADPFRARALACLREGRVTILRVTRVGQDVGVWANVASSRDGHLYRVLGRNDKWKCDCRSGLRGEPCAHVAAVRLVTTGAAA